MSAETSECRSVEADFAESLFSMKPSRLCTYHAFVLFSPSSSGVNISYLKVAHYGDKVLQTNKRPWPRFS